MIEFRGWPKIPRLFRDCLITEKIDGTNAAIIITEEGEIGAQSRNRIITPEDDNYGFASWVQANAEALKTYLGQGRHFGEWWGQGIQRKYGLAEKRFSLFNCTRFKDIYETSGGLLHCVPLLYQGPFSIEAVEQALAELAAIGSRAAPGFTGEAEGVVVYHVAANTSFKVTLHNDAEPKGKMRQG